MTDERLLGNFPTTSSLLTANQFKFNTARIPILSEYVTAVNIPSIEFVSAELGTAYGVNIPTATGKYIFEDLTVSFLVDEELESWREIYEWLRRLGPMNDESQSIMYKDCYESTTLGELTILNSAYKPKFRYKFHNMFPISLTGFSFTTTAADSIQLSSAATFRFSYYDVEKL
jgi:hypothetical protein|tara:strand:+ start:12006 stop:12524 length:519 start_codon:yes stop_codon:yes gene_type:complete